MLKNQNIKSLKFKDLKVKKNFFQQVYKVVKQIPVGEVRTYGQVAQELGTRDARRVGHLPASATPKALQAGALRRFTPRMVGWALHENRDPDVPCHRVVFKDGSLAPNYAFGGAEVQKQKLQSEGVGFVGEKVELGDIGKMFGVKSGQIGIIRDGGLGDDSVDRISI